MAHPFLDIDGTRRLLTDWFVEIAYEDGVQFGQTGTNAAGFTLGPPNAFNVTARFSDTPPFLSFESSEASRQPLVDKFASQAAERVSHGDLGRGAWYTTQLGEIPFQIGASMSLMSPLVLRLGMQTRILGWRRLGPSILLEFMENTVGEKKEPADMLLAPQASVKVHIAAPGPRHGFFSSLIAHSVIETVAAICAFALGRPVTIPFSLFPSKDDIAALEAKRIAPEILTLARKHIGLDIFSALGVPGAREFYHRARSALITWDAALQQQRDQVACILYVVAAECLSVPEAPWRQSKLTKRFVEFFDDLMPSELDAIVAHGNFEQVFELKRGNKAARTLRRAALAFIYDFRSGQLHEGLSPSYRGFALASDMQSEMRRALFADFAEGAILRYLAAPRSSLIGHPGFELALPPTAEGVAA